MHLIQNYSINYSYKNTLLDNFSSLGNIIEYSKETLIEYEQNKTDYVYLVLDGTIKQYFMDKDGNIKILLILSKGDMFGEITMIQDDFDHVNTKAFSYTKVCKISKDTFYNTLKHNPPLYDSLLLMITTKFRTLMYQIYDSTYLNTKDRLISVLRRLSVQHGVTKDKVREIDLNLTHEEIANMIGSTRSTVSRLLKTLELEGEITRVGKKIIVHSSATSHD